MTDIIYDMETQDPDDAMTLAFLTWHPFAQLRAVTVTPGTKAQIGVVKEILHRCGAKNIPVGSRTLDKKSDCVSEWHYKALGMVGAAEPDGWGHDIIADTIDQHPFVTLVTGAPLGNPKEFLLKHHQKIETWVCQGGFAGDNVVEPQYRLEKFAGRITCPTFNFNGDREGAKMMLLSLKVGMRLLVSKNVCHGVLYDQARHQTLMQNPRKEEGWKTMAHLLSTYVKGGGGKLMHDPLAACVALRREIATFRSVEVFTEKGEWGSRLKDGTNTLITVDVNKEAFFKMIGGVS